MEKILDLPWTFYGRKILKEWSKNEIGKLYEGHEDNIEHETKSQEIKGTPMRWVQND